MKLSSVILAIMALATSALARYPHPPVAKCLTTNQASNIISNFTYLLKNPKGPDFNSTADGLLADEFAVFSDSINFISQKPLGAASFPSKQAFINGQAQTPPIPTVTTEEIIHTCNKIAWRWVGSGIGSGKMVSRGIMTMDINDGQIAAVYSEFNNGAWLVDLGKFAYNTTA